MNVLNAAVRIPFTENLILPVGEPTFLSDPEPRETIEIQFVLLMATPEISRCMIRGVETSYHTSRST